MTWATRRCPQNVFQTNKSFSMPTPFPSCATLPVQQRDCIDPHRDDMILSGSDLHLHSVAHGALRLDRRPASTDFAGMVVSVPSSSGGFRLLADKTMAIV